jgi:acetyl esterase
VVEFADAPLLSAADARWFWEQYVGVDHPGGDHLAAPLRAESLRDLRPALIITAEVDPIRDDAEAYAQRLRRRPRLPDEVCRRPPHAVPPISFRAK